MGSLGEEKHDSALADQSELTVVQDLTGADVPWSLSIVCTSSFSGLHSSPSSKFCVWPHFQTLSGTYLGASYLQTDSSFLLLQMI